MVLWRQEKRVTPKALALQAKKGPLEAPLHRLKKEVKKWENLTKVGTTNPNFNKKETKN